MGWIILLVVVLLIVGWLVLTYNGLIAARNRTQEAWSEIDVELKRRHDLIPNLVNTVQGYMCHERGTLEAATNARATAVASGGPRDLPRPARAGGGRAPGLAGPPPQRCPDGCDRAVSTRAPSAATAAGLPVSMSSSWLTPSPLTVQLAGPTTSSPSKRPIFAC